VRKLLLESKNDRAGMLRKLINGATKGKITFNKKKNTSPSIQR
jgi:hypothetical protein